MSHTMDLSAATPLTHWGVIRARGADAALFLHGQLTQSVSDLSNAQVRLAGYCNPQGRLMASFWMLRGIADDEIWLAASRDVVAPTVKRLNMFVLRAKCQISDASDEIACLGLLDEAQALERGGACTLDGLRLARLSDALGRKRTLVLASAAQASTASGEPGPWEALEVQAAIARITAATSAAFVPQMVNFEVTGGVNFKKGCFPGQEVVARSQYRGSVKRRLALLEGEGPMQPGQDVCNAQGEALGTVVLAASQSGSTWALASLPVAAMHAAASIQSASGAPLAWRALPYAMPNAEAGE